MTATDDHNDDVALAGEYALHLLDANARRAFEDRLNSEPALRRLVSEWDAHFAALADEFAQVAPPAIVKTRIEDDLFNKPAKGRSGFSIWRAFMGAGFASALGLAVFLALPPANESDPFEPSLTAELAAEDRSLVVLANFAPDAGILRLDRQAGGARQGRVLELWLIAEGATVPVSLGVLPADATVDIILPDDLVDAVANGTLAISDEPIGGSPTGAPTGDVLAAGVVVSI